MQTGKNMVSRTSILAHGAAFLAVGVALGICGRAAADFYDVRSTSAPAAVARNVLVMTPATEDSPALMVWVAAEFDETATAPIHATLSYRLAPESPSTPRAQQTTSSR